MKPTKNRVFCSNCHYTKMLFPTQEKADNFIKFNAGDIAENSTRVPVRSYFCPACGGWHVTHKEDASVYARTDEQNDKAFKLGVFVSSLKKDFDKKDWKKWKKLLDLHKGWMEELESLPEHRLFLLEAKRQFKHYDKLVANGEREEQKKEFRKLNDINSERKILCAEIRNKMKDLNLKDSIVSAERLKQVMAMPAFELSEKKIIQECQSMTDCLLDEEKREKLQSIINSLQFLNGRMDYIPTDELEKMINTMEENFVFVSCGLKNKKFLVTWQNRISKCQKYLKGRTGNDTDDDTVDKALKILDAHYENIRQNLIDSVTSLQEGRNDMAIEYLTMADNRLKAVPMSARKIEMMKYLTAVADKCTLE